MSNNKKSEILTKNQNEGSDHQQLNLKTEKVKLFYWFIFKL